MVLLPRQSFIHYVSSADPFRLEGPLSVLFNDAKALHHCLRKVCVTAHQNHTEFHSVSSCDVFEVTVPPQCTPCMTLPSHGDAVSQLRPPIQHCTEPDQDLRKLFCLSVFFSTTTASENVSSADPFRLEGPLSVLFNDAKALHHCLRKVCDGPSKSH